MDKIVKVKFTNKFHNSEYVASVKEQYTKAADGTMSDDVLMELDGQSACHGDKYAARKYNEIVKALCPHGLGSCSCESMNESEVTE